jgi:hypothetical protein
MAALAFHPKTPEKPGVGRQFSRNSSDFRIFINEGIASAKFSRSSHPTLTNSRFPPHDRPAEIAVSDRNRFARTSPRMLQQQKLEGRGGGVRARRVSCQPAGSEPEAFRTKHKTCALKFFLYRDVEESPDWVCVRRVVTLIPVSRKRRRSIEDIIDTESERSIG